MTPDHTGFYWARSKHCQWFNLIIEVGGDSPFFTLLAFNTRDNKVGPIRSWEIEEWGTEIVRPVAKVEKGPFT